MSERITAEELQAQAKNIAEQVHATAPEGVGFAVLFYLKGKNLQDTPVGFAANATTPREKQELVAILREFANRQGGVILLA